VTNGKKESGEEEKSSATIGFEIVVTCRGGALHASAPRPCQQRKKRERATAEGEYANANKTGLGEGVGQKCCGTIEHSTQTAESKGKLGKKSV